MQAAHVRVGVVVSGEQCRVGFFINDRHIEHAIRKTPIRNTTPSLDPTEYVRGNQ